MIIAGDNHTFLIDSEGHILSCGQNGLGQLGLGSNDIQTSFKIVNTELSPAKRSYPDLRLTIKAISVGDEHSVMITDQDRVAVCGSNYRGQLGISSTTQFISEFTILPDLPICKMASCGLNTTIILTYSGDIMMSGVGIIDGIAPQLLEFTNCNKLFISDNNDDDYTFNANWIRVCNERLLVIDDEQQLWYADSNQRPILINSGINTVEACMIEEDILIRNEDGEVFQYSLYSTSQSNDVIIDNVVSMENTANRVFAQQADGSVAIITSTEVNLLDLDEDVIVKRIGVSNNSTFIYGNDDLLAEGYNYNGQLGLGIEYYNQHVESLTIVDISGEDTEASGYSGFSGFNEIDYIGEFDDEINMVLGNDSENEDYIEDEDVDDIDEYDEDD